MEYREYYVPVNTPSQPSGNHRVSEVPRPAVASESGKHKPASEQSTSWRVRLLRRIFPDTARRAERYAVPGLVAWTGDGPYSHKVGNMSATGLYLVSKERWTPGTTIQMTLQRKDSEAASSKRYIRVRSQVVRWGDDGAGFHFLLSDFSNSKDREVLPGEATDRKVIEQFLREVQAEAS